MKVSCIFVFKIVVDTCIRLFVKSKRLYLFYVSSFVIRFFFFYPTGFSNVTHYILYIFDTPHI